MIILFGVSGVCRATLRVSDILESDNEAAGYIPVSAETVWWYEVFDTSYNIATVQRAWLEVIVERKSNQWSICNTICERSWNKKIFPVSS